MPRTSRNIVEFAVDGILLRARFEHQHCDEHPTDFVEIPIYREEVILVGRNRATERQKVRQVLVRYVTDAKVENPIIVEGSRGPMEIRHITTCHLETGVGDGVWEERGKGTSMCSVNDKYDWRFGIKASLEAAIAAAGIEDEGPVLGAFYTELPKKDYPVEVEE